MNSRAFFEQLRTAASRLFPRHCGLCGAESGAARLCAGCAAELPRHDAPVCPVCALPSPAGAVCGACLKRAPAFDATRAALVYAWPVDVWIPRFKYHDRLDLAPLLAELLAAAMAGQPRPDALVPMPLHPARLAARGFNHAGEIARELGRRIDVPVEADWARRTRDTPPQQTLALAARRRNVRGAFECAAAMHGRYIVLVDDVMTSGATLNELARAARHAGATAVSCAVVARAL